MIGCLVDKETRGGFKPLQMKKKYANVFYSVNLLSYSWYY